ncbi:Rpn family recombination-promoting nuclease/putative transposase, partial [Alloalcanivorax mobilis]|uniref:Rpn family recombination-promoting nuclease/putative transposase n=1 Tax=Alloalcanivorax mobilis TaxID=2019569 RepID=UPI000C7776C0
LGFVKENWIKELDLDSLEKVSESFVSDDLRSRHNDVIWRVRWRQRWVYLYLMLEFQSTVDYYMAVRLLSYIGLLYQDLIRRGEVKQGGALPLVLPIVLYNGKRRWRAPTALRGLFDWMPAAFARYVPFYHFVLLDEGRLSEPDFPKGKNVVAAVFRMEQSNSPEELLNAVRLLVSWVREPEQESLRHGIIEWLHRRGESLDPSLDWQSIYSLEEATMLEDRIKEWKAQYRQEGRQEGSTEEARLILSRFLSRRFGPLPSDMEQRLEQAPLDQLESWIDRFYDAGSLEQVFH